MKTLFLALTFVVALVASTVSHAQIVSVQGVPNPQTGEVYTVSADLKDAVLQIATDSVTFTELSGPTKFVYVIYDCKASTTGGVYTRYYNGKVINERVWVYNGATIFDGLATKMCYAAYGKAAAAPLRNYLDGKK